MQQSFEKLEVWQKSRDLAIYIYRLTDNFPLWEKYNVITQLRRSALSVSSNIAEGSGKIGVRDKMSFLSISYGSLMEMLNLSILSSDLGFIDQKDLLAIREFQIEISRMLSGLRKAFQKQL